MVETVVGRWSRDINGMRKDAEEMESKAGEIRKQAVQRWKNNLDAINKEFKKFVNEVKGRTQERFEHIWGTQADKEAWDRRIG